MKIHDCFGCIAQHVHVGLLHLGNISAVRRGTSHARVGGETNLVVDHNMNGPVCGVVRQVGEMKCLVHNTLTWERNVYLMYRDMYMYVY